MTLSYQEVSERLEFSSFKPDDLEKIGLVLASTIFMHLSYIQYHKKGIKDYDLTVKHQYTLSTYGKDFCDGISNKKSNIEIYRYQELLRGFILYVGMLNVEGRGNKSVRYNLKDRVKKDMMVYMRKLSNIRK